MTIALSVAKKSYCSSSVSKAAETAAARSYQATASSRARSACSYCNANPTDVGSIWGMFGSVVRSGDTLAVLKLDGLDPLIAWGTGGRTGHTTMAVWEDGQLYVCESTDASPTGAYWPPPYGVIRTPWERWLALADEAGGRALEPQLGRVDGRGQRELHLICLGHCRGGVEVVWCAAVDAQPSDKQ